MVTKSWALISSKEGKKNKPERRTPLDLTAIDWEMKNLNVLSLDRFIGNMKKRRLVSVIARWRLKERNFI